MPTGIYERKRGVFKRKPLSQEHKDKIGLPQRRTEVKCIRCGETDKEKMQKCSPRHDGYGSYCKDCKKRIRQAPGYKEKEKAHARRYNFKRKYDLSSEDVERMYQEQNGLCALCFRPVERVTRYVSVVDHDHVTGQVRGIVHHACNALLGFAGDDPAILDLAKAYLLRNLARGTA